MEHLQNIVPSLYGAFLFESEVELRWSYQLPDPSCFRRCYAHAILFGLTRSLDASGRVALAVTHQGSLRAIRRCKG